MDLLLRRITSSLRCYSTYDKELILEIKLIVGSDPLNLSLYRLVTQHASVAKHNDFGVKESNERLEYLGDAIFGAVVTEFLYKKYPYKPEGFLTEVRSKIVNRESLNELGRKIGILNIMKVGGAVNVSKSHNLLGDGLEALIGAVYLDRGYFHCRRFVLNKLLLTHFNMDVIIKNRKSHKSKLIEWAQKDNRIVHFFIDEKTEKKQRQFIARIVINEETYGVAEAFSKKKAEQLASQKSCEIIGLE